MPERKQSQEIALVGRTRFACSRSMKMQISLRCRMLSGWRTHRTEGHLGLSRPECAEGKVPNEAVNLLKIKPLVYGEASKAVNMLKTGNLLVVKPSTY